MKTITVIVNGIEVPYHLVDHAINRAKQDAASIAVLFLKGIDEPKRGYGFPSDLGLAENFVSEDEAVREDEAIISDNMELVEEILSAESIHYELVVKRNATVDEVATICSTSDLVIVDENFENTSLRDKKISLAELQQHLHMPVEVIKQSK